MPNNRLPLYFGLFLWLRLASSIQAQTNEVSWPMAGNNPARTSWSTETVSGNLRAVWYRPIEPYIPDYEQLVAANGLVYVATARGLYAFNTDTGAQAWTFPTELPLGNSPTISNGVAYVGGLDHSLYALNATTGQLLWKFTAEAGFLTNPLVIQGLVIAGNRDGNLYAIHDDTSAQKGTLAWKFTTGGPIDYSAAAINDTVYLVSNDMYAYALRLSDGTQLWKSAKLPGYRYSAWWPVVWGDNLVISASPVHRQYSGPGPANDWHDLNRTAVFGDLNATRSELGPRTSDGRMEVSSVLNYLETYPERRTAIILNRTTGQELSLDTNQNGKPEYAPFLWTGTKAGNRYPPIVGPDGYLYQSMTYLASGQYQARAQVLGWKLSDPQYVKIPTSVTRAYDEPLGYTGGGNLIYETLCCDRAATGFNIATGENFSYWSYNLDRTNGSSGILPGYNRFYWGTGFEANFGIVYGSQNGVYGSHGYQNAPIPYGGKLFVHRSNALIALAVGGTAASPLPAAATVSPQATGTSIPISQLQSRLVTEVQKMLTAGHLRPGFGISGNADRLPLSGAKLEDYYHWPSNTLYTLALAMPHLPTTMQAQVRTYLQNEYSAYPPNIYSHTGYANGTPREDFIHLPENDSALSANNPSGNTNFEGWSFNPFTFYELWKYALVMGNAKTVFDSVSGQLGTPPADSLLIERPYLANAWISGLWGYLELQRLAGYPETTSVRASLDRLLSLRVDNFSKDAPYPDDTHNYIRMLNVARNFMYLTPELGEYLVQRLGTKLQEAYAEYDRIAPYWFINAFEATYAEGAYQSLYDTNALMSAKAYIFHQSREELTKYLDVAAMPRGDLFYIQHLVMAIEAPSNGSPSPSPTPSPTPTKPGDANNDNRVDGLDYIIWLTHYNQAVSGPSVGDFNNNNRVDGQDYVIWLNNYQR